MNPQDLDQFQKVVRLILESEKTESAVKPVPVEDLYHFLDLSLEEEELSDEAFYPILEKLIEHTPKTSGKLFFNQLIGGRRSKAVLGDLIASILNNSMYTYKVAGPMVGIEKTIIQKIAELIGYRSTASGTIASGSSMSNFMAMVMARDRASNTSQEGVTQKMTAYTSVESHYSIIKNAGLMGIGKQQVRFIESDDKGRMLIQKLKEKIEEDLETGYLPFFVNLTSGTTVLGAFDDIQEAYQVTAPHDIWLHVDGAYGGAVLFSKKYKKHLAGIELSDSFNLSAHKMLGVPLTCSVFVCQQKEYLYESFSSDASYLYQTDPDDYNPGKTSLQCGRRNDALKLWTLWKSIGTKGIEKMVDHQFHLAGIARNYIKSDPDYTLYNHNDSVSVCFNYKGISPKLLSKQLYLSGELMVSHGSFKNQDFIRLVTINSDNSEQDIFHFFKIIETFVNKNPNLLNQ